MKISQIRGMRRGTETDAEILKLLQIAPEKGLRLLFDVYHTQLCVYAMQLTDSFHLAEDIVQDFFITFWERKHYLHISGNFRNYLYTSVHNAALAILKKKKLISMEELTNIPVDIPPEAGYDEEESCRREKELMQKLEKLPRQEILAIKAVILENKKCVEAAEELSISVNTLKTHLSRGLRKLRKDYNLSILIY